MGKSNIELNATVHPLRHARRRTACSETVNGCIVCRMSRITVSPGIHFGKPCVAGTRIPVQAVLELVRDGVPAETIIRDYYPDLQPEDIKACVQYAIDIVQTEDLHVSVVE